MKKTASPDHEHGSASRKGRSLLRLPAVLPGIMLLLLISSCSTYQQMENLGETYPSAASYFSDEGIPSVPSSYPEFYYEGPDWTDRAVELAESAEHSILIDTFLIGEHPNADRIFQALAEARARGVDVRLLFDSSSYYRIDRNTHESVYVPVSEVKKSGIPVTEYNPIRAARIYRLLNLFDRDHRKFWVIDGETAVAGGMNIDPDSLAAPEKRGSIDGMTEIRSPEAARLLTESFIRTWNTFSLEQLQPESFLPESFSSETVLPNESPEQRDAGGESGAPLETRVWVFDQHMHADSTTTDMFNGFLALAKEDVWMIQCYTIVNPALLDRIRQATDRGVSVHVILSANHVSDRFTKATYYGMLDLIEAGAEVLLYESPTGSLLHKKLMLTDGHLLSVGSANYNFRSQYLSREISFVFDDAEAVRRIEPFLNWVLKDCRSVSREEAESYRGFAYFMAFIMMQVAG